AEQMRAGCWASFYEQPNFNGDSLTLIGPVELQTLDRGSATQLKRDIKSVVTGPRATLVVYQKQMLSARSVGFQPNTREAGLVEALGFGGRIEPLKMTCSLPSSWTMTARRRTVWVWSVLLACSLLALVGAALWFGR